MQASTDLNNGQLWDIRENILYILEKVMNDQIYGECKQVLTMHKLKLAQELQKCDKDQQDLYMKEI